MENLEKVVIEKPTPASGAPAEDVTTVKDAMGILGQAGKQVITGTVKGIRTKIENQRLSKTLARMIGEGQVLDMSGLEDLSPEERTQVLKETLLQTQSSHAKEMKTLRARIDTQDAQIATLQNQQYDLGETLNSVIDVINGSSG